MCVPARGYFYSLSSQLRSPLAGAVALFVLRLLHSTKFFCGKDCTEYDQSDSSIQKILCSRTGIFLFVKLPHLRDVALVLRLLHSTKFLW